MLVVVFESSDNSLSFRNSDSKTPISTKSAALFQGGTDVSTGKI